MAKKESKYGKLSASGAVQRGKEQLEKKGGKGALNVDCEFWKPKKGINVFDIIPYEISIKNHPTGRPAGELYQQLAYRLHFGIGADNRTLVCPTTIGKKCPICERRAELFKDPNADDEELRELKARDRVAFNVIDLDDEDAGIQVFDFSPHLFANSLYEELDDAGGELDCVFDLAGGLSIKARFKEKTLGKNKFLEVSRIDFEDRDDYGDDIVEEAHDLDAALNILSYEEIEAIFLDIEGPGGTIPQGDEEEEKPKTSRRGRKADEEEEEKPSRGRRKPEPEPEEEPEEEEEPTTTRSRRGKPAQEEEKEEEPAKTRRGRKAEPELEEEEPEEEAGDGKCPHGLNFAVDCETDDVCDTCDEWDACRDALDALDAKKNKKRNK